MSIYSEKLKDPRWQRKRLEIMQRDKFECRWCGNNENTLMIHHLKYIHNLEPWEYEDKYLLTLCKECHDEYHEDIKEIEKELLNTLRESALSHYFIKIIIESIKIDSDEIFYCAANHSLKNYKMRKYATI